MSFEGGTAFLVFRSFFITVMTLGMMCSLSDFRFRVRTLLGILVLYLGWVAFVTVALLRLGGEDLLLRAFLLFISTPALAIAYWAARDTPAQAIFNYMTQITFSLLGASACRQATIALGLSDVANILLMGVFYLLVIALEWNVLRRPFRAFVRLLPARWGTLSLIPCVFCVYLLFLASWPKNYLGDPIQTAYLFAGVIPLVVVYVAVFKSIYDQYRDQVDKQAAALMAVQASALRQKLEALRASDEATRIERHDLRHRIQTVTELVARGDRDEALEFLGAAARRLDDHQTTRWCRPPVLDATLASYFDQARMRGIHVDARVSLPEELPVDEGELALVFANALENAIHACERLPESEREVRCRAVSSPGVMLEVANACDGTVRFDARGLPVSGEEGHGVGIQSIVAFCAKHDASLSCELEGGWFFLRVVL